MAGFARGIRVGVALAVLACRAEAPSEPVDPDDALAPVGNDLPVRHVADPEAAARGQALFEQGTLFDPTLPALGFESLWAVWGTGPITGDAYWDTFRERYGMLEAPYDNDGYPVGLRVDDDYGLLDCYTCHVGEVAGEVTRGVANSTFDMQGLYDDLAALAGLAGLTTVPLEQGTGAIGANDAWGLGVTLVNDLDPDPALNLHFGYQRPSAWWTLKYKDRMYSDGCAEADGYRTMMAMLLAYGFTIEQAAALEPQFQDLQQYLWSIEAPPWPYDPPEANAASRGSALFEAHCARCHGVHSGPDAAYPDLVVSLDEIGTDPQRAGNFGQREADHLTAFMGATFGADPLVSTGGYLAPPLVGVWARAPYFHNGSVPDLASVLDAASRPDVWLRTGGSADDFDPQRVGWRYEVPAEPLDTSTREGRRIHDAARPGMSNAGHTFGDVLSDDERADVIAYLLTL